MAGIIPLPLEPIKNCPLLDIMPPYARGCVIAVLIDWWIAGCPDISKVDVQTATRMRHCDYLRHKDRITEALDTLTPLYRAKHAKRQIGRKTHQFMAVLAREAKEVKRQKTKQEANITLAETKETRGIQLPHKIAKGYETGRTDMQARSAAVERDTLAKAKGGLLVDKPSPPVQTIEVNQ